MNKLLLILIVGLCSILSVQTACIVTVAAGVTMEEYYKKYCPDPNTAYARGCSNFNCKTIFPGQRIPLPADLCNC